MQVFNDFVSELSAKGILVFAISGNHDSAQRVSYFSQLLKKADVYISDTFTGCLQTFTLQDEFGPLNVHLLPFVKPSLVRNLLPQEKVTDYQSAVEAVLRHSHINKNERNVLLCHQFIIGAVTSESEERIVGTLDEIPGSVFDDFDYVALGHLHRPQRVTRDTLRYSGSPLKYSFSEENDRKSVTIVDVGQKGNVDVHTVPLTPLRDLYCVEGTLEELMNGGYVQDYVWVTIHDETVPPDAKITLSARFGSMLKFSVRNSKTRTDMDINNLEVMENKNIRELFSDFYAMQNNGVYPEQDRLEYVDILLKEMGEQ